jgi:sec-independent protein translocase protein TatA
MFGSFGWMELLLILIIVLIIFGAGKIPQLGEGLGKAIKGFKKSVNEADALDVTPTGENQNQTPSEGQGASPQHVASGAQRHDTTQGQPQYAARQAEQMLG